MQHHTRLDISLRLLVVAAACLVAASAFAQQDRLPPETDVCEPPISVCNFGPIIRGAPDGSRPDIYPPPSVCPDGYACTCVPSCPECDDCAAQVCVRSHKRECKTACDCPSGLGCFDGRCIAGFAPVFCCDTGPCPKGQQCQHREGDMDFCPASMCEERLAKVSKRIGKWVGRKNRCETASDCAWVDTSTGCQGTCGAFVNKEKRDKVASKIQRVDEKYCGDPGCPFITPLCVRQEPACVEGRCTGVPGGIVLDR